MAIETVLSSRDGVPLLGYDRSSGAMVNLSAPGGPSSGLFFPPTQQPSPNPNVLDDYEEGPWTPVLLGAGGQSGQTYVAQEGHYIKIGTMVWVQGRIDLSALGTLTTSVRIGGFPFAFGSLGPNAQNMIPIQLWLNLTVAKVQMSMLGAFGQTFADLWSASAAATSLVSTVQADLANNTILIFTGCYSAGA